MNIITCTLSINTCTHCTYKHNVQTQINITVYTKKTVAVNTSENNQLSESDAYKLQVNHQ